MSVVSKHGPQHPAYEGLISVARRRQVPHVPAQGSPSRTSTCAEPSAVQPITAPAEKSATVSSPFSTVIGKAGNIGLLSLRLNKVRLSQPPKPKPVRAMPTLEHPLKQGKPFPCLCKAACYLIDLSIYQRENQMIWM